MTCPSPPPPAPPEWTDAELAAMLDGAAVGWEHEPTGWPGGPGPAEAIGAGFTHRDPGGPGAGFEAGGSFDQMLPCAALAAFTGGAHDDGLPVLSDDELVGVLAAARRLQSWQAAIELSAAAELDRRRTVGRPVSSRDDQHVAEELAAALTLTGRAADALLGLARALHRLPAVRAALLAGSIDLAKAKVMADELDGLDDAAAARVADQVLGRAGQMTTSQLRHLLRRLILASDPDAAHDRAARARRDARIESCDEVSGNTALAGRELPPADVIAATARITAIAHALNDAGAVATIDQLRAAVFLALLTGRDPATLAPNHPDPHAAASPGGLGWTARLTGTVHLVMPLASWLGQSGQPGEAAGHGPIDPDACRDLAARLAAGPATRWCLTLTDTNGRAAAHACAHGPPPPGQPGLPATAWLRSLTFRALETGTCRHPRRSPSYRPPSQLAHLVRIRQRTCAFPGCVRPATGCDLDHTRPYDDGGPTCECNLAPLCRRHHQAKQGPGWQLAQDQPGVMTWRLPGGRRYATYGTPYPV